MRAFLLALLLPGCAGFSGPLMDPKVAWNPQIEGVWDPCPYFLPYLDPGPQENGKIVCTTRPLDFDNQDIDELNIP